MWLFAIVANVLKSFLGVPTVARWRFDETVPRPDTQIDGSHRKRTQGGMCVVQGFGVVVDEALIQIGM